MSKKPCSNLGEKLIGHFLLTLSCTTFRLQRESNLFEHTVSIRDPKVEIEMMDIKVSITFDPTIVDPPPHPPTTLLATVNHTLRKILQLLLAFTPCQQPLPFSLFNCFIHCFKLSSPLFAYYKQGGARYLFYPGPPQVGLRREGNLRTGNYGDEA